MHKFDLVFPLAQYYMINEGKKTVMCLTKGFYNADPLDIGDEFGALASDNYPRASTCKVLDVRKISIHELSGHEIKKLGYEDFTFFIPSWDNINPKEPYVDNPEVYYVEFRH